MNELFSNHSGDVKYSSLVYVNCNTGLQQNLHVRRVDKANYSPFNYHTDVTLCDQKFVNAKDMGFVPNISQLDFLASKGSQVVLEDVTQKPYTLNVCQDCVQLARLVMLL